MKLKICVRVKKGQTLKLNIIEIRLFAFSTISAIIAIDQTENDVGVTWSRTPLSNVYPVQNFVLNKKFFGGLTVPAAFTIYGHFSNRGYGNPLFRKNHIG